LANKIKDVEVDHEIDNYLPSIFDVLKDLSKEELIKKMVSVEFNRFLSYYKKKRDISNAPSDRGAERESRSFSNEGSAVRYFINIGSRDNFDWMSLKDFLRDTLELGRDDVYKVDVKEGFSFFNTDAEHSDRVMEMLNQIQLEGRKINVEISKNEGSSRNSGRRDHNGRSGGGGFSGNFPKRDGGRGRSEGGNSFGRERSSERQPGRRSADAPRSSGAPVKSFEAAKSRRTRKS
jgi:ATP-dependent RNA helicase DeaD